MLTKKRFPKYLTSQNVSLDNIHFVPILNTNIITEGKEGK